MSKLNPLETLLRFNAPKELRPRLRRVAKARGQGCDMSKLMREGVEAHVTAEEIRLGIVKGSPPDQESFTEAPFSSRRLKVTKRGRRRVKS